MIKLQNVSKSFGEKQVLRDFSLRIKKGDRVCLMGASGVGKSTVMNLVLGIEKADSGTVETQGRISAVFQEDRLCEDFSALSNVCLVAEKPDKEKAKMLLESLGLMDAIEKPVKEMSGGMKRRTTIARALFYEHDILLLDEAFTGLDEETKTAVAELINRHTAEKTVLLISHDEKEAELLGAKIIEM